MLTLKLWRALKRPPNLTAIYRRAYVRQQHEESTTTIHIPILNFFASIFKNLSMAVLPVVLILFGTPIVMLLFYLALLLSPFLVPLANTIYGLTHAISASGNIAKERERQTYDVICTSPIGVLGVHWSYCTGWLHYHATYRNALVVVVIIGVAASLLGLAAQVVFGVESAPTVISLVRGLALAALFMIDYAQTIVISSLTTLLVPTYAENEGNARVWASSLFLVLQMGVYVPTLLIGMVALPSTFPLLGIAPEVGDLITPLLYVVFFVVLREVVITGLWHRVEEQLSTTRVELDAITRVAV
jgi:hypothetical protein